MKKSTKMLLLGLGMGLIVSVIVEHPKEFGEILKAMKDEKPEKRIEIDITPRKDDVK